MTGGHSGADPVRAMDALDSMYERGDKDYVL
jgi:hypothetical protein